MERILHRTIFRWIFKTVSFFILGVAMWLKSKQLDDMFFFAQTLPQLISKLNFVLWIILVIILQENVNAMKKYTELFVVDDGMKWDRKPFKYFNTEYGGMNTRRSEQNLMECLNTLRN